MAKLANVDADRLREALESADSAKAAKRLMVVLAYTDGVDVDTLQEQYGFAQSTIYFWLDRLESRPLDEALVDDSRPGRPPKLPVDKRAVVESWLEDEPASDDWTAEALRERIAEEFDVHYSVPHVKRTFLEG